MGILRRGAPILLALAALASPAAAGEGKADFAAEMAKLRKDYDEMRDAYYKDRPPQPAKNPDPVLIPKFLDLARRAKGTDDGVRAASFVVWKVANGPQDLRKSAEEALDLALATGLKSPALAEMATWIRFGAWGMGEERAVAALKAIGEKAAVPEAKSAGLFNLAVLLSESAKSGPGERKEARGLLDRVLKEFAGTSSAKAAPGYCFELDRLQVGMVAPDFEAVDQDGVKFRLSDYRGKVVLLDFWGFW